MLHAFIVSYQVPAGYLPSTESTTAPFPKLDPESTTSM